MTADERDSEDDVTAGDGIANDSSKRSERRAACQAERQHAQKRCAQWRQLMRETQHADDSSASSASSERYAT